MNNTDALNVELLSDIAEECLIRAFGQKDDENERGYISGVLTSIYIIGGIGDPEFLYLRVDKCFRATLPDAGSQVF